MLRPSFADNIPKPTYAIARPIFQHSPIFSDTSSLGAESRRELCGGFGSEIEKEKVCGNGREDVPDGLALKPGVWHVEGAPKRPPIRGVAY